MNDKPKKFLVVSPGVAPPSKDWRKTDWESGARETFDKILAQNPAGFLIIYEDLSGVKSWEVWPPILSMGCELANQANLMLNPKTDFDEGDE